MWRAEPGTSFNYYWIWSLFHCILHLICSDIIAICIFFDQIKKINKYAIVNITRLFSFEARCRIRSVSSDEWESFFQRIRTLLSKSRMKMESCWLPKYLRNVPFLSRLFMNSLWAAISTCRSCKWNIEHRIHETSVRARLGLWGLRLVTARVIIIIIIFYFENVAFFHAKLGSDVCPRVDNQTSGDTLQDLTSGKTDY